MTHTYTFVIIVGRRVDKNDPTKFKERCYSCNGTVFLTDEQIKQYEEYPGSPNTIKVQCAPCYGES